MDSKVLGAVQLIGALLSGYMGYSDGNWSVVIIAVVLLVMAVNHFME